MGVTIDNFGASFKKYMPGVRRTLNDSVYVKNIPKGRLKWQGEDLNFTVHVARNVAVSNIADGGAFPAAGKQSYVIGNAGRRFLVGSVQITDGALKNASSTENAAISVVESELTGMLDGMRKYCNIMWTRSGDGVVALVGQTASGATFTVDDARGLWDNKDYEIRDATTPTTIHDTFTVSSTGRSIDANGEATITPSATLAASGQAAGDYIVWGTGSTSSYGRALTGLDALVDDASATFQGISTATYPRYTSPVLDNSGTDRPLSPTLFRQMLAMLKQESGDAPKQGMDVVTSVWGSINVEELYENDLRLRSSDTVAGLAVASFQSTLGKINIVNDPDTKYGKMFFLAPEELTYAVQAELDWRRDNPGGSIFKRSDTATVYKATALEIGELVIEQRNRCGKIEDLTETKTTAY